MLSLSLMLRYEKVMFASGTPVLLAVKLPTISILPFEESALWRLRKFVRLLGRQWVAEAAPKMHRIQMHRWL